MKRQLLLVLFLGLITLQGIFSQILYLDSENASYINAAAYSPANEVILFFSGPAVMLYDINKTEITDTQWYKLDGFDEIQAAVTWTDDQVVIFNENNYRIFEVSSAGFINENDTWLGWPEEWNNNIDAAVRWSDDEIMFFKDSVYLIYNFTEEAYTLIGNCNEWDGWPEYWESGLDAVFTLNDQVYFLNEGEALQYSLDDQIFYEPTPIGFEIEEEEKE